MKRTLSLILLALASEGVFAAVVGDYGVWATGGGYANGYWDYIAPSCFGGYQQLGATLNGTTAYEVRPVFKFDISGLNAGDTVGIAGIVFLSDGVGLAASGDVIMETFYSAEIPAVFSDAFGTPATASKVAFDATAPGTYDGIRYYLITVDVTSWLQSAVDNSHDVFSVRLTTPFLLEPDVITGLTVRYLGPVAADIKPARMDYSVVPEPCAIGFLASGLIVALIKRKNRKPSSI